MQHQCTKHIEIDLYFARVKVAAKAVRVLHVSTANHVPVCRHLHQGSANIDLHQVLLQSECSLRWLSIDNKTVGGC
jgi:hypothetical protein